MEITARRRRQFWLQIFLPVLLAALLVIALGVLSTRAQNNQVHLWGNISQIIVVIPVLVSCLLTLVILAAGVYGMGKLLGFLPGVLRQVQYYAYLAELRVRQIADKAAAPFIRSKSSVDGVRSALRRR